MNDLQDAIVQLKFHMFADDTVIYLAGNNSNTVQHILNYELPSLKSWFQENKFKLNTNKTQVILAKTA